VARAVRTAVALPLFVQAVPIGRHNYYDGGTLDILPVRPVLDIERPPDTVVAVGGFHRPGFAGDDMTGWRDRPASILDAAWQVRSGQHLQLGRNSLERLHREVGDVIAVDPVPYHFVAGVGLYREFLDNRNWPEFMRMGYRVTARALRRHRPLSLPRSATPG
jgi:NTE family protein